MKDPWGYERFRVGDLVVRTKEDEIVVENYIPEGAGYAGSPTIMTMDEAVGLANLIIKIAMEQKHAL